MSFTSLDTDTRKQLFADLKTDEIKPGIITPYHAKKGEGEAFHIIGNKYYDRKDYSKAMTWYWLPADKKYPASNVNIGNLYHSGEGVMTDDLAALEWYLKAGKGKNKAAFTIIGHFLENGFGIGVNKYKALEWYNRIDKVSENASRLNKEGIHLDKETERNHKLEMDNRKLRRAITHPLNGNEENGVATHESNSIDGSKHDIDYTTLGSFEDNNDLNYDSDEQEIKIAVNGKA